MAKRTLTFFFLTICISLLNAQAEDHWAVSLRAGFGSTTADEAITQITLISAEDEIVREVDMGMMAGYTGGIDLRLATTDKYLFSASLDVLDVSDRSQVYANTNGFIDDGRGRQITEQNSYLAATAAIGVHYRITEDDSKLDWQVGGVLTYSWFTHNYKSAFTVITSGGDAFSTSNVFSTRNSGKREGLAVEMKIAYLITPRIGLGITGRYGLEGREFNRARMLALGVQYSFGE
ncbi:hypothetical protein FUA23_12565 [Neolewinella aurantiaca]|uniref:Outer membrane protein beta-barrel domain-containing protein n=1 Tax=Neolewinella aurantiaca TaxID=2602767 RepID=A0A5C7FR13_9BACT|nr:hypothetical protein [Neolewinella aurantiaca]TXF88891.1 hypothetical protein FUA23_12565 [Neolewinella aurantiaca]